MRREEHSHPGIQFAAWNVIKDTLPHRCFPASFVKLEKTSILPVP